MFYLTVSIQDNSLGSIFTPYLPMQKPINNMNKRVINITENVLLFYDTSSITVRAQPCVSYVYDNGSTIKQYTCCLALKTLTSDTTVQRARQVYVQLLYYRVIILKISNMDISLYSYVAISIYCIRTRKFQKFIYFMGRKLSVKILTYFV